MQMKGDWFADGYLRYQDGHWRDENGDIVDVVEVVRCHDCASCTDETRNQETVHCKVFSAFMDRNDFCSRGTKHED